MQSSHLKHFHSDYPGEIVFSILWPFYLFLLELLSGRKMCTSLIYLSTVNNSLVTQLRHSSSWLLHKLLLLQAQVKSCSERIWIYLNLSFFLFLLHLTSFPACVQLGMTPIMPTEQSSETFESICTSGGTWSLVCSHCQAARTRH